MRYYICGKCGAHKSDEPKCDNCFNPVRVTSLTGQIDKSGALVQWAANCAADWLYENGHNYTDYKEACAKAKKEFRNVSSVALDVGSIVHDMVEDYYLKRPFRHNAGDNEEVGNCWDAFMKWHHKYNPNVINTEFTVFNVVEGYAGTLDMIAEIDASLLPKKLGLTGTARILIDTKTSKAVYREYHYQTKLYQKALASDTHRIYVDARAILRLDKATGEYEFKFSPNDKQDERVANALVTLYYASHPRIEKQFNKAMEVAE